MAQITLTKHVAAPPEIVFDVASDLPHAAEYVGGIEKIELITSEPIGVGTKWRETRKMMGHESTETLEITAFDRPHSYTVGCETCGSYFKTTFRFAPVAGGTSVTLDVRTESRSLMATLMSPLAGLMLGSMMRRCMDDDLEDIKRVAEERAATVRS